MDGGGIGMVAEFAWTAGMDTSLCGCEGAVVSTRKTGVKGNYVLLEDSFEST